MENGKNEGRAIAVLKNKRVFYAGAILAGLAVFVLLAVVINFFKRLPGHLPSGDQEKPTVAGDELTGQGQALYDKLKDSFVWPATVAGPVVITFSEQYNYHYLKIYAADLDYLMASEALDIKLTSVTGPNGQELLEKNSPFETKSFFTAIDLTRTNTPVVHLSGDRRIDTVGFDSENQISKVGGKVIVKIPQGRQTKTYTADQLTAPPDFSDIPTSADPITAYMKDSEDHEDEIDLVITTVSDLQNLSAVEIYTAKGERRGGGWKSNLDNGFVYHIPKSEGVSKVIISYTERIETKGYEFTLELPETMKGPPDITGPDSTEPPDTANPDDSKPPDTVLSSDDTKLREEIIAGLAQTRKDLEAASSAGDAAKLREIFAYAAPGEEELQTLAEADDEDILQAAEFIIVFIPKPDVTWITDPEVTWVIEANQATISFVEDDEGKVTIVAVKKDGKWH